jgi:hypothetical protein
MRLDAEVRGERPPSETWCTGKAGGCWLSLQPQSSPDPGHRFGSECWTLPHDLQWQGRDSTPQHVVLAGVGVGRKGIFGIEVPDG